MSRLGADSAGALAVVMAAPLLAVAAQFTVVRPTNFAGADEWLVLSLASRGIIAFPYASRPLDLMWCLPAVTLFPHDLMGHLVFQVLYLGITGTLVAWYAARRLHLSPAGALVAGVVAACWAPLDRMRLDAVVTTRYSGSTMAALAAALLFMEGWRRGRPAIAAGGAAIAVTTVLSMEGTLPLLAGAPLLALAAVPGTLRDATERRRLLLWSTGWALVLLLAAAPLLVSMAGFRNQEYQYQSRIGLDLHPVRLGGRLVRQFAYSLGPLITTPLHELWRAPVLLAVAIVVVGLALVWPARSNSSDPDSDRGPAARAAAVGLALAALGWLGLVMGALLKTPARAQFLSAPGVGLLLGGSAALIASRMPAHARRWVLALIAVWMAAVGTGRITALQDEWDRTSVWPGERATMAQLAGYAPALLPNTVVVLIDESKSWLVTLMFRHAVHYIYGEQVVGVMWKGVDFFSPTTFTPDGIRSEPFAPIREVWRSPVSHHRYDEAVVARFTSDRRLQVLDEWPLALGPLPPGATYAPHARIVHGPPPAAARILSRER